MPSDHSTYILLDRHVRVNQGLSCKSVDNWPDVYCRRKSRRLRPVTATLARTWPLTAGDCAAQWRHGDVINNSVDWTMPIGLSSTNGAAADHHFNCLCSVSMHNLHRHIDAEIVGQQRVLRLSPVSPHRLPLPTQQPARIRESAARGLYCRPCSTDANNKRFMLKKLPF